MFCNNDVQASGEDLVILHVAHLLHLQFAVPIVLYLPVSYCFTRNINLFLQSMEIM